jgi:uncharacterized Zn finger protein
MSSSRYEDWQLRRMAGEVTYARGAAYAKEGRVNLLSIGPAIVRAQVSGAEVYSVVLKGDSDDIWGECECPAFEGRGLCKHLVAVALTVNAASSEVLGTVKQTQDLVRAHLAALGHDVLIDRLMALAVQDSKLWRRLELEAALKSEDDDSIFQRIAAEMDTALDVGGHVDWRGAGAVAEDLREVVGQFQELVDAGRNNAALRLLNRLFDDASDLQESVDDSDGEVRDALDAAQGLHLRACVAARPDPAAIAAELFQRELEDDYGLWEDTYDVYADVLGPVGIAEFRRLAATAFRANPSDRLRLRRILDGFAEAEGDVDARIRLRAADASSAWDYQQIAQICLDAGRQAEALKWAEEGVWKNEDSPNPDLIQLTARLLREQGHADKAQKLLWRMFEHSPDMRLYRALLAGEETKDSLVDRCARVIEASLAKKPGSWWGAPGLLVEILLDAGRNGQAWAAAQAHNCGQQTLLRLAKATQDSHPDEALDVYVRLIERSVSTTTQGGYEEAIGYLSCLAQLRSTQGRDGEHAAHVEALAIRHKAKRNFIKLLRGMPNAS